MLFSNVFKLCPDVPIICSTYISYIETNKLRSIVFEMLSICFQICSIMCSTMFKHVFKCFRKIVNRNHQSQPVKIPYRPTPVIKLSLFSCWYRFIYNNSACSFAHMFSCVFKMFSNMFQTISKCFQNHFRMSS